MQVLHSNSDDVFENLAVEDLLLDKGGHEPIVFIYKNAPAVVLGKNQNPWKECAVGSLHSLGVKLARRVSGGGTVYHDAGNLNIACILPREQYQRCEMLHVFMQGLAGVGVKATIVGGTSIAVGGRKISGNAFCYRRANVLHHGTMLWRADLEKLRLALTPDIPEITTRAVASVPMPVINLCDLAPDQTEENIVHQIIEALSGKWGDATQVGPDMFDKIDFAQRVEKLSSWEWVYGATPDFDCEISNVKLHVHRGKIFSIDGDEQHAGTGQRFPAT